MTRLDDLVAQLALLTKESLTPKELDRLKKLLADVNKCIEKTQQLLQLNDEEVLNFYPLQYHVSKAFIDAMDKCQTLLNSFQLKQLRDFYSLDPSPTFENAMHLVRGRFVTTPDLSDIDDEPEALNMTSMNESFYNSSNFVPVSNIVRTTSVHNLIALAPASSEKCPDDLSLSQGSEANPIMPLGNGSSIVRQETRHHHSVVTDLLEALEEAPDTVQAKLPTRALVSLNAAITTSLHNLTNPSANSLARSQPISGSASSTNLTSSLQRMDFALSEDREDDVVYLGENDSF